MRLAGEHLATVLRRIDDQRIVAMVPIPRLLTVVIFAVFDFLAVHVVPEIQIPGIFAQIDAGPRAGPGRRLPNPHLVVTGPGMTAGAELPDIARQHHHQCRGPSHRRHMEIVTDPFPVVNRRGFDVPQSRAQRTMRSFGAAIHLMHVSRS
jgi:hypothetical protein